MGEKLVIEIDAKDGFTGKFKQVNRSLADTDKHVSKLDKAGQMLGSGMSKLGHIMARTAKWGAIGLAALGVAATKLGADFDQSMRNVNSIAQLSEKSFASLSDSVLKIAADVGKAPKELADGLYDIASSGFAGKKGLTVLAASAKAARAGMSTVAVASKAVTGVLNAYGMKAEQAGMVSDVLFRTVDRGVITFEELSEGLGDVTSTAAAMGVSISEVGGALAAFTKAGVKPPEAVTALNRVIMAFIKPSKAMEVLLKKTGFESGQALLKTKGLAGAMDIMSKATGGSVTKLAELFPEVRGIKGALIAVAGGGKVFKTEMGEVGKSAGATARALKEQKKGMLATWEDLKAKLEVGAIRIASKFILPNLKSIISKVEKGDWEGAGRTLGKMIGDGLSTLWDEVFGSKTVEGKAKTAGGSFISGFWSGAKGGIQKILASDSMEARAFKAMIGMAGGAKVGGPWGAAYGGLVGYLSSQKQTPQATITRGLFGPLSLILGPLWDKISSVFSATPAHAAERPGRGKSAPSAKGGGSVSYKVAATVDTSAIDNKLTAWASHLRVRFGKWGISAARNYGAGLRRGSADIVPAFYVAIGEVAKYAEVANRRYLKWGRAGQNSYARGMTAGVGAIMTSWNRNVRKLEHGAILLNARSVKWGQTFATKWGAGVSSRVSAMVAPVERAFNRIRAILAQLNTILGGLTSGAGGSGLGGHAGGRGENDLFASVLEGLGFRGALTPSRVIEIAKRSVGNVGDPYVWGASGPNGSDCSGAASYAIYGGSRRYTSGSFPGVLAPGNGLVKVLGYQGNPGHVWWQVAGREFEQSGGWHKNASARGGAGYSGVPVLQTGGDILKTGIALVHEQERVVPAEARPLRGGDDGTTVHIHVGEGAFGDVMVEGIEDVYGFMAGMRDFMADFQRESRRARQMGD